MRRLGSTFVTVWLITFVPSFMLWGLMVRWSEHGARRFEAVWRWLADLLAFPVLFSPLTNWSWRALETNSAIPATMGFLILVAIWALMLTAPLIFIAGWWVLISQRIGGRSYSDSYSTASGTSLSATLSSPSRAFYLITLPLGLIWTGGIRLFGWRPARTAFKLTGVWFILVIIFYALLFGQSTYLNRFLVLEWFNSTIWFGYLDTLHAPRIFHQSWLEAIHAIYRNAELMEVREWPGYMGSWYRYPEFRTVVWLTAARHAVPVITIYLGYCLIKELARKGG